MCFPAQCSGLTPIRRISNRAWRAKARVQQDTALLAFLNTVGGSDRQAAIPDTKQGLSGLDPATLTMAIVDQRGREQWTTAFSRSWGLPRRGPAP